MQKTTTATKKTPPEVPPPAPSSPWALSVRSEVLSGDVLMHEKSSVSPILALGDAIARWEDAMLKQNYNAAAEAAFDAVWLARECKLRRGDEGSEVLQMELKVGFQPTDPLTK